MTIYQGSFEQDLLLRDVMALSVNWYEGYGNSPTLILELAGERFKYFNGIVTDGIPFEVYDKLPFYKNNRREGNIFYAAHPMGWVKYFSHCGDPGINEGGFGGAPFGVVDQSSNTYVLGGPWSSRAAVVNMAVDEHPDKVIMDVSTNPSCNAHAIKTAAVKFLAEHYKFPYHIIRGKKPFGEEQNPWGISLKADSFEKPSGSYGGDAGEIEILYSPEKEG